MPDIGSGVDGIIINIFETQLAPGTFSIFCFQRSAAAGRYYEAIKSWPHCSTETPGSVERKLEPCQVIIIILFKKELGKIRKSDLVAAPVIHESPINLSSQV